MKDIASGESLLFAPRLPAEYAVWLGQIKPLSHFKVIILSKVQDPCNWRILLKLLYICLLQERYMVSSVYYTDEIAKVLHEKYQGPGKPLLYLLHGLNTDSNNYSKPADFEVLILINSESFL